MKTMTLPTIDTAGKKKGTVSVSTAVFSSTVNESLLEQALRIYRNNQRQATKHSKTRGEVTATKAKAWRQKGTGRARHGARSAPIFVGGGTAHGPTGNENYKGKLTKKMRKVAFRSVLSLRNSQKELLVIDNMDVVKGKTKTMRDILTKIVDYPSTKKVLLVLDTPNMEIVNAANNLTGVSTTQVERLNVYELVYNDRIVMSKKAAEIASTLFDPEKVSSKVEQAGEA